MFSCTAISSGHVGDIIRTSPTTSDTQKIQYGGWETGSSYIYILSEDF